jgi:hypothetical protein
MDRRELLKMVAAATGGVVIGGEFFLAGCKNPDAGVGTSATFTESDIAFLDEVAETIFPKTSTPGAKEAKVGQFMTVMVNDCYTEDNQKAFHEGQAAINAACKKMHGHDFMKASPEHKKAVLVSLDPDVKEYQAKRKEFNKEQDDLEKKAQANGDTNFERKTMPDHYFTMMKQLTILGYFTSKEGRTGATRYEPVPGKYIGDLDYKKGDKIFTGLN